MVAGEHRGECRRAGTSLGPRPQLPFQHLRFLNLLPPAPPLLRKMLILIFTTEHSVKNESFKTPWHAYNRAACSASSCANPPKHHGMRVINAGVVAGHERSWRAHVLTASYRTRAEGERDLGKGGVLFRLLTKEAARRSARAVPSSAWSAWPSLLSCSSLPKQRKSKHRRFRPRRVRHLLRRMPCPWNVRCFACIYCHKGAAADGPQSPAHALHVQARTRAHARAAYLVTARRRVFSSCSLSSVCCSCFRGSCLLECVTECSRSLGRSGARASVASVPWPLAIRCCTRASLASSCASALAITCHDHSTYVTIRYKSACLVRPAPPGMQPKSAAYTAAVYAATQQRPHHKQALARRSVEPIALHAP